MEVTSRIESATTQRVLEGVLCFALATGMWRAVRARHYHALVCGGLLGYLLLADLHAASAVSQPHQVFDVFSYMLLGPLAARERAASVLLPALALHHPLGLRACRIALSSLASWWCLSESAKLNPLLPRAYELDGIAMPFAGAAVVDAVEGVLLLWAYVMAAQGV